MIGDRIHFISFHFVVQRGDVERFGCVGKFSSQHCIHVDPSAKKKGHCQYVQNINIVKCVNTRWKAGRLMVSAIDSEASGPGSSPGRDNLLSQCLSPPRCISGYRRI